jgi:phage/plasmid-associated DNA primase
VNPASGADAVQQMEDLSSPISAFLRDCCVMGRYHVEVDALWAAWKGWCEGDNRHPGTKAVFSRDLRAAVPTLKHRRPRKDDDRYHIYEGIGLRSEANTVENTPDHPDHEPAGQGSGQGGQGSSAMYSPYENPDRDAAWEQADARFKGGWKS